MNLKDAGIYDLSNIFKGKPTAAHNTSNGGIINNISRVINIPAYQRPYRWTSENINRLFQDYDENRSEYFLGSAVVVEKPRDSMIEFDVVDGQQRITTLYLLNYIRFLLKREYVLDKLSKPYQPKSSEYCNGLKDCYADLVGKNSRPFDNILKKINELSDDEEMDSNERVKQLTECYKQELCIPEDKSTKQETQQERLNQIRRFFGNEQLSLKYSRARYDKILRDAMCNVYLRKVPETNNFELALIFSEYEDFAKTYVEAMQTIFNNIWERAKAQVDSNRASIIDICQKAIDFADEIIKNMSFCIVLTENENDANKLFEVLNDRALKVEDLELIKNHFYKEYCTKSGDSDEQKDKNITILDEIWADKIFAERGEAKNRLISYLAAVYLTGDKELGYKDDARFKNAIEKGYSSVYYASGKEEYGFESILADFNTYYAVKIILSSFELKTRSLNAESLKAEQEEKSITYKVIHLLNALGYHAVIPALTNVIISTYAQNHKLTSDDFENTFKTYINGLIDDKRQEKEEYVIIHRCAHMLWTAAIKAEDHTIPRAIAKRIIGKYHFKTYSSDEMDFLSSEVKDLDQSLQKWMNGWTYSNKKTFAVKVLLLNLLLSNRIPHDKAYNVASVKIDLQSALTYKLDAGKLQLDHLEAEQIGSSDPAKYYLGDDIDKRQKEINGYFGNFMILDAKDNNEKNNVPLADAIGFYNKINKSWLVEDIVDMINDREYFDDTLKIPKEAFFVERTRRLKKYFEALLNRSFNQEQIKVTF